MFAFCRLPQTIITHFVEHIKGKIQEKLINAAIRVPNKIAKDQSGMRFWQLG